MSKCELPEPAAIQTGRIDGTQYSVYGRGEPLVLIHGVGMEQRIWLPQLHALSDRYQVITYDMLGHGGSRTPSEDVVLADYAAQLQHLLDQLDIDTAAVAGHSMGALVALEFAIRFPARVRRVAALNAVFMRSAAQQEAVRQRALLLKTAGVASTLDATIARWFGQPIPPEHVLAANDIIGIMRRVDPTGYQRSYQLFAESDAVHAEALKTLAMPALFMTGELDPNSTPSMSKAMADRTPNSTFDVLKNARHMMTVTSASEVNQRLSLFLEGKPVGRQAASCSDA
ncbi:MAG: alpha/beta fold hydrolase [Pusillimonas sp.]